MNYYQDSNFGCCINKNNYDNFNDYSRKNYNNSNEYANNDWNHQYCVKKIEETFCCYPSYYNEDKKEDNKEKCFEGTFKICPKRYNHYDCGKFEKNDCYNKNDEQNCGCKNNNRCCGFCGFNKLFRW